MTTPIRHLSVALLPLDNERLQNLFGPLDENLRQIEIAFDVIQRTKDLNDPESVLASLVETELNTIIGPISWKGGPNNPVKNVCKTPLVGGQWTKTDKGYDLVITTNPQHPEIPTGGNVRLLG